MKSKLFVALVGVLVTYLGMLVAGKVFDAVAQTALDPTQSGAFPKYPFYLGASCGAVSQVQYGEDGLTAQFRFSTVCPGSGRGSKPTIYLACWSVEFAPDRYTVVSQELLLSAHWKQGSAAYQCPSL